MRALEVNWPYLASKRRIWTIGDPRSVHPWPLTDMLIYSREEQGIPGTSLNALREDDRIPIVLIQQSLESKDSNDSQAIHGWTLMVPAGWSMAFFNSLIYTGSRVAGQRERQTQAFESGTAHFPQDYPSTLAHEGWATKREEEEKGKWDRKPPAKRVNFDILGTMDPWKTNWHGLLGTKERQNAEQGTSHPDFISTQRDQESAEEALDGTTENIRPWLLRGAEVPKILSRLYSVFNHGTSLLSDINRLRLKRNPSLLIDDKEATNLLKGALINVKVKMCSRGTPEDLAMIYVLPDEVVLQWEKVLCSSKVSDDESLKELEVTISSFHVLSLTEMHAVSEHHPRSKFNNWLRNDRSIFAHERPRLCSWCS
jgi:ribonuclease P/MRP protein subunit POP1